MSRTALSSSIPVSERMRRGMASGSSSSVSTFIDSEPLVADEFEVISNTVKFTPSPLNHSRAIRFPGTVDSSAIVTSRKIFITQDRSDVMVRLLYQTASPLIVNTIIDLDVSANIAGIGNNFNVAAGFTVNIQIPVLTGVSPSTQWTDPVRLFDKNETSLSPMGWIVVTRNGLTDTYSGNLNLLQLMLISVPKTSGSYRAQ